MAVGSKGWLTLLLVLIGLPLVSCKRSSSSDPGVPARFVHASEGAGPLDVYVRATGQRILAAFAEERVSVPLNFRGPVTFDVRTAGSAAGSAPLISQSVDFTGPDGFSMVIAGDPNSTAAADRLRVLVVQEEFAPAQFPLARVRVINASPDSTGLGLDINGDGNYELEGLGRFEQTPPDGNNYLPSDSNIPFVAGDGVPAVDIDNFTLQSLNDTDKYFLIALGRSAAAAGASDALRFLVVNNSGVQSFVRSDPRMYFLTASADAGSMQIDLDGNTIATGQDFGDLVGPLQLGVGVHQLDYFIGANLAGTFFTKELVSGTTTLTLLAGGVTGVPGDQGLKIRFQRAVMADDPGNARIQAITAASDAAALDIGVSVAGEIIPPVLFSGLQYMDTSDPAGLALAPGLDTYGVAPNTTTTTTHEFDVNLVADLRSFWIFAGSYTGIGGQVPFQLLEVVTNAEPWVVLPIAPN